MKIWVWPTVIIEYSNFSYICRKFYYNISLSVSYFISEYSLFKISKFYHFLLLNVTFKLYCVIFLIAIK